ncbi:FAD-binding oxidoreductase [soil metagenome]
MNKQLPSEFKAEIGERFASDFLTLEPADLETYGRDWTRVYDAAPSAVVFPRSTEQVSMFLKMCSLHKIAIVPSGGRTGLSGGAVAANGEVVVSLSRMNKIHPVELLSSTVRVQAGAITQAVHEHCQPLGLTWPIDFSAKGSSHIGGNIATNAGGQRVIRYGLTRHWVNGLQVVTMNGDILELNGTLQKNNTGLDLCQLFIGTEGTLGIITEATLKLTPLPVQTELFFFATNNLSSSLELLKYTKLYGPFTILTFEYLSNDCLNSVLKLGKHKSPFEAPSDSYVLLEVESRDSADQREKLDDWMRTALENDLIVDGVLAQSHEERNDLWALREGVSESLSAQGLVHKNDIALPITKLDEFAKVLQSLVSRNYSNLKLFLFGHLGDGNFHVNFMKPEEMDKSKFLQICYAADLEMFETVKKFGGSVSAEHGIGLLKKKALPYSRTPAELAIFKQIKQVMDPQNLLNPGKIFD